MNTTSGISAAVKPFREVPTYYFGSRNYGVMCVQVILVKDEYIRGVAWWVALLQGDLWFKSQVKEEAFLCGVLHVLLVFVWFFWCDPYSLKACRIGELEILKMAHPGYFLAYSFPDSL